MRYDPDDIEDVLDIQRPLIARPATENPLQTVIGPVDPFEEFARLYGFKAPIDVEARLAAMTYMGDGDSGIHQTQLSCSASLVVAGQVDDETIVESLLKATEAAAGAYGITWNWKREEKALRRMVETARAKFPSKPPLPPREPKPPPQTAPGPSSGGPAEVVQLEEERKARQKPPPRSPKTKADDDPVIARLGDALITYWQKTYGLLISTETGMATYSAETNIWTHFDEGLELRLKVSIQGIFASSGVKPTIATLNAVRRYVVENPALHRENVPWNASGLIVCRNTAVDPRDGSTHELGPELYATWRMECDFDPSAACPRFVEFLLTALAGIDEEEQGRIVATLGEHMGASLVTGKPRGLRKALYFLGKTRSGKTRLANIYRAFFGGPGRCTAIKLYALNDMFGAAPLLKAAAWIADDVAKQGGGGRHAVPIDAELLKNIITGEPMAIRVAGGKYIETDGLDLPVVWTGNNLPMIRDDGNAVYNRLVVFPLNNEWPEDAPNPDPLGREIDAILIEEELAGILNFAIFGYARLARRGYYDLPETMMTAANELRDTNQPVVAWITACTEEAAEFEVDNRDLMGSLRGWWLQEYGEDERVPGGRTANAALKRHWPSLQPYRSNGQRISMGIRLTDEGIGCLRHAVETAAPMGRMIGSGQDPGRANRHSPVTKVGKYRVDEKERH